jgi:uncharacterized membrane protein
MMVLLDLTAMVLSLLLLPLVGAPAPASWGLLALSVLLHTGYKVLLLQSYRVGELYQVHPLARGTGPLLVAGFAVLVLGERLARCSWPGWPESAAGWRCCWRRAGRSRAGARCWGTPWPLGWPSPPTR